jgi:DNA mismatch endonuclease (patch repair protein)
MADVFTKAKRSAVMSRIRSRGNKDTELALASLFRRQGISGWRRQIQLRTTEPVTRRDPATRGRARRRQQASGAAIGSRGRKKDVEVVRVRPDFVFPRLRLAVFVDCCFWHACPVHATKPRSNAAFWRRKLAANKARDRRVNRTLRAAGWRVLRIWEHELARKNEARLLRRLQLKMSLISRERTQGTQREANHG